MQRNWECGEARECGDKRNESESTLGDWRCGLFVEDRQRLRERGGQRRSGASGEPDRMRETEETASKLKKINRLVSKRGLYHMQCGITFVAWQLPGHCGRTGLLGGNRKRGNGTTSLEDVGEQRGRVEYPARRMFF